ncbi:MAG: tRNA (guanine(46)-N(7))-methyltransferase TrmB [Pseudomonadota bacterium]
MADKERLSATSRLFGRRQGHALRGRQAKLVETLLPELLVDPAEFPDRLAELFPNPIERIAVEIGFGGGEHLAFEAERQPATGFIGAEAYLNGFGKILPELVDRNLSNVRLFMGDGEVLLAALPDASITRLDLLYPDPWRKRRHWKRRFIRPQALDQLTRVIQPGGQFRFASDWPDYLTWTLMHVRRHPDFVWQARIESDWRAPWPNWPGTRYEAKALREGRKPAYLIFERR